MTSTPEIRLEGTFGEDEIAMLYEDGAVDFWWEVGKAKLVFVLKLDEKLTAGRLVKLATRRRVPNEDKDGAGAGTGRSPAGAGKAVDEDGGDSPGEKGRRVAEPEEA